MTYTAAVSRRVTRLVLGINAFYQSLQAADPANKLDVEGLVPVHWSNETPKKVNNWREALEELSHCLDDAVTLPDPWARDWLTEYILSLRTLVRWLSGEPLAYEQVVAGALRVNPRPPTQYEIETLRQALDAALASGGYTSFPNYQEQDGVVPSEVVPVMTALLAEARARTQMQLPMLQLPAEPIKVTAVSNTPFTAYCDYTGQSVWINTDVPHTRAGLKQLVGHEAYPGHYAHMGHRDALVQSEAMPSDAALVVTNTASSVLFEGIAERGLDFLAWRTDPEDRIAWLHNRLQWLCSIEAAHALNTGRSSPTEVAHFLRTTCDADEAWIEGKLRFVTHRLRAPFVYTYWWGGTVVGKWWAGVPAARADEAIAYLYSRMHSPSTLPAHWSTGDDL